MFKFRMTDMGKQCKKLFVLFTLGTTVFIAGCSEKDSNMDTKTEMNEENKEIIGENEALIGEYEGDSGSVLKINGDGTCYYKSGYDFVTDEDGKVISYEEGEGNWYIEENVIYIEASSIDGTLYGDLDDENGIQLLAEGEELDEYFTKVE